jgi:hypothetical protein
MEMQESHHEAPSCVQTEPEAGLITVPSKRRSAGDEGAESNLDNISEAASDSSWETIDDTTEAALKVAKLDTTVFRGVVDTRVKLSRLCHSCTELGNDLYEKRLEKQVTNIPILRYPRDGECALCTILHEKATAMKQHYGLKPARLFELKALPLHEDNYEDERDLYLSPVGLRLKGQRSDLVYRFFAPEDCDQRASLLRPVAVDFNKIRNWLNFCGNHHKKLCNTVTAEPWKGQYELMVMDCVEECMVMLPRGQSRYVTLSYVWGTSSPACQLELGSSINATILERTVRDAIAVTLELGLRYLWVDRYCIPQRDLREKHLQIQHMGEIYANSFLTVIACAGDDAEAGLPGVGLTPRNYNLSVLTQTWSLQSGMLVPDDEICESVWYTRGWTFQEGLLAKRRLVFSASNVYFQCTAMHHDENNRKDLASLHINSLEHFADDSFHTGVFPGYGIGKRVQDIVPVISQYLVRQFSYESDTLDAFLGILSTFERSKALVGHVGGLPVFSPGTWRNTEALSRLDMFVYGLNWAISVYQHHGAIFRRSDFPSWTWTGWRRTGDGGSFLYPTVHFPRIMIRLETETIIALPTPLNPNSELDRTPTYPRHLKIQAWTAKLSLHDENKLPNILAHELYTMQDPLPKLCKDLAMLAKEHFRLLGCSELVFEDMLLVPVQESLKSGYLHTLILCYDSKAKGYTRLPYRLRLTGTMHDRGQGHKILSPKSKRSGAMTFERRTITLV